MEYTKEQLLKRVKEDFVFFAEKAFQIIDKSDNTLKRFKLNRIQKYYWANHSAFDYIIKSRKGGMSTFNIARFVHKCNFFPNKRAIMLTQNDDATVKMFRERVMPMVKNCLWPMNVKIKESEGMIEFLDTGSTFYIGTAGSKKFGRGSDITDYHLSEFAHWDDPEVLTAVEEALMDDAEGVIETTANGINFAHQLWKKSEEGNSRYKAIFIPWVLDDTYRLKMYTPFNDLSQEEKDLVDIFHCEMDQIAWRRKKRKDMSQVELFPQEYPVTSEEAFISSSAMIFDWIALREHEKFCKEPGWRGLLKDLGEEIRYEPNSSGNLRIWRMPQLNHVYVIGADIAEGVKNGCFSAASVIDINEMEQVAEYHGHIPPDEFGDSLFNLGRFYNNALLAPESWPGVGAVTMAKLVDLRYPNLWKRKKSDYSYKLENQLYGWETTKRTKPILVHTLSEGIKEYKFKIRSRGLISEMKSFVYNGEAMEPQEGCYSDRVIGFGIAWYLANMFVQDLDDSTKTFRDIYMKGNHRGTVLAPNWKGPIYGVRG
jgi:hypothetical protein